MIALLAAACGGTTTPSTATTSAPTTTTPVESAPLIAAPTDERFEVVADGSNGPTARVFVSYPRVAGADSFNDAVGEDVRAQLDEFNELYIGDEPGGVAIPELNVSFDYLVASGDVLGVRLESYEFAGASGGTSWRTVYYDAREGLVRSAIELLTGEAAFTELVAVAQTELSDRGFGPSPNPGAGAAVRNYDSLAFLANGDLLVEFDDYQVASGGDGRVAFVVEAATVDPWLSDFGRRVQAQVMSPDGALTLPTAPPTTAAPPTTTSPTPATTPPATTDAPTTDPPPTTIPAPGSGEDVDCAIVACVALTFDDGPVASTNRLLAILAERNVQVTFFPVGSNVERNPDIAAAAVAAGHEVGNHTFDHVDLTTRSPDIIREQMQSTQAAVRAATGVTPTLFRAPYGATNGDVAAFGLPQIMWSVDPEDWKDRDADIVAQRVLAETDAGEIVLLHDIHPTSVDAIPAILDGFAERGFTVVPVTTLLGGDLTPGEVYYRR